MITRSEKKLCGPGIRPDAPKSADAGADQRKSIVYVIPRCTRIVPSFRATTDFPFDV
jgi:hypothetical protein